MLLHHGSHQLLLLLWAVGLWPTFTAVEPDPVCDADGTTCRSGGSLHEEEAKAFAERQALHEFFGPPIQRDDSWLRAVSALVAAGSLTDEAGAHLQDAVSAMRMAVTPDELQRAWQALSRARSAIAGSPASEAMTELTARFLWRYFIPLTQTLGTEADAVRAEALDAVATIPGAGAVQAGLLLATDGSKTLEMIQHLTAAAKARPGDELTALCLGIAIHGKDTTSPDSVNAMRPHVERAVKQGEIVDARLIAAFGFIAATGHMSEPGMQDLVFSALQTGAKQTGTRGGALAAIYLESIKGKVPFQICQRIYDLERYLLFSPSNCNKRLELGTVLRRLTALPQAVAAGAKLLQHFCFECPQMAETLSGMGMHWLDESDGKSNTVGLGGDLHARADIRKSIRDTSYAVLDGQLAQGKGTKTTFYHQQAMEAARTLQKRLVHPPRNCAKIPEQTPLAPPQIKFKCRDVKPEMFMKKCMKLSLPCVIRDAGSDFVKDYKGGSQLLDRWVDFAGNTSIRVAFPFEAKQSGGLKSLNGIERTTEFFTREDVQKSLEKYKQEPSDAARYPWTLVRPPNWNMRFADLVAWAKHHPQEIYMNQLMVVDLGSQAIDDLQQPEWVREAKLQILSPSLWLASGNVATGYHTDGPENLLAQLAGSKDVYLLPPHEQANLYYDEVADVEANMSLDKDGSPAVSGLSQMNRSSSGHSVIDVTDTAQSAMFPRYKDARGMQCKIEPGDVLYIPAFWHHAVATTPSEECLGLSLNMWYIQPNKPKDMNQAMEESRRQEEQRQAAKQKKAT